MQTNKDMQLKILNKMLENVENGNDLLKDIQYRNRVSLEWDDRVYDIGPTQFRSLEMRVKPETNKVNNVDIPKPLDISTLNDDEYYYFVFADDLLYDCEEGINIKHRNIKFVYETKEEAIEASKLLFGLE